MHPITKEDMTMYEGIQSRVQKEEPVLEEEPEVKKGNVVGRVGSRVKKGVVKIGRGASGLWKKAVTSMLF
jgi:hypothetical protein